MKKNSCLLPKNVKWLNLVEGLFLENIISRIGEILTREIISRTLLSNSINMYNRKHIVRNLFVECRHIYDTLMKINVIYTFPETAKQTYLSKVPNKKKSF